VADEEDQGGDVGYAGEALLAADCAAVIQRNLGDKAGFFQRAWEPAMTETDSPALEEDEPEIVHWYPPRRHMPSAVPVRAAGAASVGALAMGAVAFGALAIGALAIGRLAVGKARFRELEIDKLTVRKLKVLEP
jgi:hypothetical protein